MAWSEAHISARASLIRILQEASSNVGGVGSTAEEILVKMVEAGFEIHFAGRKVSPEPYVTTGRKAKGKP